MTIKDNTRLKRNALLDRVEAIIRETPGLESWELAEKLKMKPAELCLVLNVLARQARVQSCAHSRTYTSNGYKRYRYLYAANDKRAKEIAFARASAGMKEHKAQREVEKAERRAAIAEQYDVGEEHMEWMRYYRQQREQRLAMKQGAR